MVAVMQGNIEVFADGRDGGFLRSQVQLNSLNIMEEKKREAQESRKTEGAGRSFLRRPLFWWARLALGLIFVLASVDKLLHPEAFAKIIFNYQILPDSFINITAIILPWLELLLGGLLLAGLWLPGAVLLTNLLLVMFWGTLIFNIARGLDVQCGCFSTDSREEPATTWYFIRDTAFLLLGGYVLLRTIIRPVNYNGHLPQ